MSQNFGDVWRTVRLYVPAAPTFLVREWVNVAYKRLARLRHWTFLRGETRLTIAAARAITACVVTTGSTSVTSAGLFLAGDAGRQFRVGSFPVYTIASVTDVNTIVLDTAYGETSSATAVGEVFDGLATLPADFESFRLVADPYNQRRLPFWITEDQLNVLDPTRQVGDSGPRALVAHAPSTLASTLGRVQYTYWPRPSAARSYPALYNKQAARLDDTSVFSGVLADAAEVLTDGALAEAARWPGTSDLKNPYFDQGTAQAKQAAFLEGVQRLSLRDDDQAPDDLATVHWERWPLAEISFSDQSLRASDATVLDLY